MGNIFSCDFSRALYKVNKMRKRVFDICCSSIIFILGLPLFLMCVCAVKLSSRGSIFYVHHRIGLKGKPFCCLKFRTMVTDAEAKLEQLLAGNSFVLHEWNTYFKLKEDPRITPVGKWMRRFSLDELPQLLNVLKGDMSMVGPRPLTEDEILHVFKDKSQKILSVKPGLTSFWIIKGRNQLTLQKRIKWEVFYVDHRSFGLDCRLIAQTIVAVLFPKGAY